MLAVLRTGRPLWLEQSHRRDRVEEEEVRDQGFDQGGYFRLGHDSE